MSRRRPDVAGVGRHGDRRCEYEVHSTEPRWWWPFGSIRVSGSDGRHAYSYRRRAVPWWRFDQARRATYRMLAEWSRGLRGDLGQEGSDG